MKVIWFFHRLFCPLVLVHLVSWHQARAYHVSLDDLDKNYPGETKWIQEVFPGLDLLSIDWLQDFIRIEDIQSVEELLPRLPMALRSSYTLVKNSGALQGADAKNPRAIMFAPDARLVIAFNGDKYQQRFQHIEILDYTAADGSARFFDIDFGKSGDDRFSEANSDTCMACHSSYPRPNGHAKPIWFNYNQWFGSYGESDDRISGKEVTQYLDFLEYAKGHPRYKWLVRDSEKSFLAPYYKSTMPNEQEDGRLPESASRFYTDNGVRIDARSPMFMPGLRFAKALDARNAKRVAMQLKAHELYKGFPHALLFNVMCSPDVVRNLQRSDDLNLPDEIPRLALADFGMDKSDTTLLFADYRSDYDSGNKFTGTVSMIAYQLAIDLLSEGSALSATFNPSYWRAYYSNFLKNEDENYLQTETYKYLWSWSYLMDRVSPGFSFSTLTSKDYNIVGDGDQKGRKALVRVCEELGQKAAGEYKGKESNYPQFKDKNRGKFLDSFYGKSAVKSRAERSTRQILRQCAGCHDHSNPEVNFAPYIPFANAAQLAKYIRAGQVASGNLAIDRIREVTSEKKKLAHLGGRRMPLGLRPLSEAEREKLIDYLEQL